MATVPPLSLGRLGEEPVPPNAPTVGAADAPPASRHQGIAEAKDLRHHRSQQVNPRTRGEIVQRSCGPLYELSPAERSKFVEQLNAALDSTHPSSAAAAEPDGQDHQWNLNDWMQGAGVHEAVAAAINGAVVASATAAQAGSRDMACLEFVRTLSRDALAKLLTNKAVLDDLVDRTWAHVQALQKAQAATSKEIQSKFAGAVELSYTGLDTYFKGLEGVVGPPSPRLLEGIEADHTLGPGTESTDDFVTENYGVRTTSKIEWLYVRGTDRVGVDPATGNDIAESVPARLVQQKTLKQLELEEWPSEAADKLADRSKRRSRRALTHLQDAAKPYNERLEADQQPPLVLAELVATNLYTGPLYVKYNAVLRGKLSTSPFLRNVMIKHCCPKGIFDQFIGNVGETEMFKMANGELSFEDAERSLNKYPTTLHGINSAIIKLGKLTVVQRVYRGIHDRKLPVEFWRPNKYGVRGGVDQSFLSTTRDRKEALKYAQGDKMGILIEVQQGMVNRGADVEWLSQYPHEEETLFGPLSGIEVLRTRIDGSVVVIECSLSINLAALTLEQVLGKRRKVVADMCEQLADKTKRSASEWTDVPMDAVDAFLQQRFMPLAAKPAEHYNDNAPLGEAIADAVALAEIVTQWPHGLEALAQQAVVKGSDAQAVAEGGAMPIARLVECGDPLSLSVRQSAALQEAVHGVCALMWMRRAPFTLDLSKCKVGAHGLAVVGRAMNRTLTGLDLSKSDCANNGGDLSGLRRLCANAEGLTTVDLSQNDLKGDAASLIADHIQFMAVLSSLDLSGNDLCGVRAGNYDPSGIQALAAALGSGSAVMTECSLLENHLDVDSAKMLAKIGTDKQIMLSGMKRDQTKANFYKQGLRPADAILIASDLPFMAVLTSLDLSENDLNAEAGKALASALAGNAVLTHLNLSNNSLTGSYPYEDMSAIHAICEALKSGRAVLRSIDVGFNELNEEAALGIVRAARQLDRMTSLGLAYCKIGTGAKEIAEYVSGSAELTDLDLRYNNLDAAWSSKRALTDAAERRTAPLALKLD